MVVVSTLQLSAVAGDPKSTPVASQLAASTLTVMSVTVIVGSMLSTTVTVWVAVAVLPEPSVTVQVTVVSPNGKLVGASLVVVSTLQLSAVVGNPKSTPVASQLAVLTLTVTASGAVIVGSMLSTGISYTKLDVATPPFVSVTCSVIVVTPV